jgi:hypothetical protein
MFCITFGIERPPPCVNYLTVYMKMLLLDMVGLPVVLSSPPRLRFFILY